MNLSKRIFVALAALVLVVLGANFASAQTIAFDLSTAPTFVANTGRSEVMGQVTLTANVICGTNADANCISTAGTIQVLYQGTPIDDAIATANVGTLTTNGIEICENIGAVITCNGAGTYLTSLASMVVTNTTAGGVVSFGVNGAVNFAAGDQILVRGVRGQIDLGPGNVVGTSILGQLTASPSTIAGFVPTQEVVARSADPLTMAFTPLTILQCRPGVGVGTVTAIEGFNTAFVDQGGAVAVDPADTVVTLNPRPLFSPSPVGRVARNSRINIVLTGLPTGVKITWPNASAVDSGTGLTGAQLLKVSQSVSGDNALYVFVSPDQALSDINGEKFVITVTAAANVTLSGTPADFGTATAQGQMFDAASSESQPRYNHPLEPVPGATFLTVAPCTTNLLFPWVLNFANADTGLAIANTSADPYGTLPQTGTCTVNLFPTDKTTNNGVSAGGAISITTAAIQPGSVWRTAMSGTPAFAGLAGYIIAVCRFQYGHGFAFITDNFPNSPVTAQGYIALLIPDPVILTRRSAAVSADDVNFGVAPYGEGLTE
jgi:hypothetical protein